MGYIYKVTNLVNQKIYIGKTTETPEARWKNHVWEAFHNKNKSNSLLHTAMLKYGLDSFIVETVGEFPNKELDLKEREYIKLFESHRSTGKGYNITWGGEGCLRYSDEEILSLWEQGLNGTQIAEALSARTTTICLRLKDLVGKETAQQRKTEQCRKAVCQYSLDGTFIQTWESGSAAEEGLNLCRGSVSRCCHFLRTKSGDYFWLFEGDKTPIEVLKENYAKSQQCHAVDLIDSEGKILKTYASGREAEKELNLARGKVSEVCNGKREHTGGYLFQWNYPTKRSLVNAKFK